MDIESLTAQQIVEELEKSNQTIRQQQALEIRLLARLPARYAHPDFASTEVGLLLQLPADTAANRLADAVRMATCLPRTLEMLESGKIDLPRAMAILQVTMACDDAVAATVEEKVLEKAPSKTTAQVRRAARDAVIRADPDGYAQRHQRAAKDRGVVVYDADDGMAVLRMENTSPVVQAVYAKVDLLASQIKDPSRSKDAIRADVLADLVLTGPQDSGPKPLIQITMPLSTLVGYNDDPCELAGYGLIPADVARDLAADPDSVWNRLITDPVSGQLLDYGTRTYRPPAGLDRFVRARDKTCRHPGCRRPARRCDLDHTIPFPKGDTSEKNLCARCERHHQFKHLDGVTVVQHDDGTIDLTTPLGRTYTTEVPPF